jgi:hypothetical protein
MKRGFGFSWFPRERVGWKGFGAPQQQLFVVEVVPGRGIYHMRLDFLGGNCQVPRKAHNEAWGGGWAATLSEPGSYTTIWAHLVSLSMWVVKSTVRV